MADSTVVPSEVTEDLRRILADAGISDNADLVARILATGIGLGMDGADRLDLKIASSALTEMRAVFGRQMQQGKAPAQAPQPAPADA